MARVRGGLRQPISESVPMLCKSQPYRPIESFTSPQMSTYTGTQTQLTSAPGSTPPRTNVGTPLSPAPARGEIGGAGLEQIWLGPPTFPNQESPHLSFNCPFSLVVMAK